MRQRAGGDESERRDPHESAAQQNGSEHGAGRVRPKTSHAHSERFQEAGPAVSGQGADAAPDPILDGRGGNRGKSDDEPDREGKQTSPSRSSPHQSDEKRRGHHIAETEQTMA